jgi:deoxyribose-phosphate aldolase
VRPNYVSRAASNLRGTPIKIATVISFPEGTDPTASKISSSHTALSDGAHELDVVLNRTVLQTGSYPAVYAELHAIREACPKASLKLILETSQLTTDDIVTASVIANDAGWDYVKTSTGFCGRGASLEDVRSMRSVAFAMKGRQSRDGRGVMKVKASGGVRTLEQALCFVDAGASRIGTSNGVGIIKEEGL